jgi:L-threonylcarbamoyladenylate synthase
LLRPGLVTPSEIEAVVGPIVRGADPKAAVAASPGLLARHYAPRARVEVTTDDRARVEELAKGARVGWLSLGATNGPSGAIVIPMSNDPSAYAARLYAALHELDAHGVEVIVVAAPPDDDAWLGVRDRLARASA